MVLVFVLLGMLAVAARYQSREQSQLALADSLWRLSYDLSFEADLQVGEQDTATLIQIGRPYLTPFLENLGEHISETSPSLHKEDWENQSSGNREYRLTTRHAGKYRVTAEYNLRLLATGAWSGRSQLENLSDSRRRNFTSGGKDFPTQSSSVGKVLQRLPRANLMTESEKLEWFHRFCSNELARATGEDEGDDVLWALASKRTSPVGRAKVFVTLCRAVDIPARLVVGFELRQSGRAQPHVWAEVHRENHWVPFDPVHGFSRVMPKWFVPIRRGDEKVIRTKGAKNVVVHYSILRSATDPKVLQAEGRRLSHIFDLTRLPLNLHGTLSLMLLLPFGALVTAVFRNIVGLRTLGTFAPALLAMSFIYAAWGMALVILAVVVIVGLAGRAMLERLHLLMVPRLSIILTTIILCVVFAISLLNYFVPEQSAQTVLIPLVILTILIERFFVTSEEDSTRYAVQLVLGTVVVATFCYLLLRWDDVGQLVLIYPEIHFFTIALFILIGRYTGYRLTELWRFRDLVPEEGVPGEGVPDGGEEKVTPAAPASAADPQSPAVKTPQKEMPSQDAPQQDKPPQ